MTWLWASGEAIHESLARGHVTRAHRIKGKTEICLRKPSIQVDFVSVKARFGLQYSTSKKKVTISDLEVGYTTILPSVGALYPILSLSSQPLFAAFSFSRLRTNSLLRRWRSRSPPSMSPVATSCAAWAHRSFLATSCTDAFPMSLAKLPRQMHRARQCESLAACAHSCQLVCEHSIVERGDAWNGWCAAKKGRRRGKRKDKLEWK